MATELNLDVIARHGLRGARRAPGPTTCVVAIRADDDDGVASGLAALDARAGRPQVGRLAVRRLRRGAARPARSGAAVAVGGANLALVSVPGQHATIEAFDAIDRGVSVMLFSDNVAGRGRGAPQGRRGRRATCSSWVRTAGPPSSAASRSASPTSSSAGPVGIVAASGTGAQQVMALLDAAGVGREPLPRRGRARPLGRRRRAAPPDRRSRALAADAATESILVVSKPPAAEVLADLERYAAGLGKPVHWATLGRGSTRPHGGRRGLPARPGATVPTWPTWSPPRPASLKDPPGQDPTILRVGGHGRPLPARAVLRRHPGRRGDAGRRRRAGRHPVQHPARARPGARRRPARRRPRRHRLRRRRADPRPGPPDDRPDPAAGADRRRGAPTRLRRAAARPRPRARRPPRPRPPSWPTPSGRRASAARADGRDAAGRRLADRHPTATRRAGQRCRRDAGRGRRLGPPVQRRSHPARAVDLLAEHRPRRERPR